MEWKHLTGFSSFCAKLEVPEPRVRYAMGSLDETYKQKQKLDVRTGKVRDLCYPPRRSALYEVQGQIKDKILDSLPLLEQVQGYRKQSHNIMAAEEPCLHRFNGKVDIAKFHPSTTPSHVRFALVEHGLSHCWARWIARLTTYNGSLPQGAPSSNHIANLVIDTFFRRSLKHYAAARHIGFVNYGDDINFFGSDASAIRACVRHTKAELAAIGYATNEKTRECEHRGEAREFLGCSTSRLKPGYPRDKYREFRSELRRLLREERERGDAAPILGKQELRSIRHRIAYVARLSPNKARTLLDLYYRIRAAVMGESVPPPGTAAPVTSK